MGGQRPLPDLKDFEFSCYIRSDVTIHRVQVLGHTIFHLVNRCYTFIDSQP
jgi:hypothetical protein